ncbi:MAG: SulP family inorganic anion transporter, partial [Proteobacteria bacterium]|nr:SulP family inorganic anion transporter [Pseudomonadota bacterium]
IKGMLASIGLIIILRQIPHAVGWDHDFIGDESFDQKIDHDNTFSGITHALERVSPGAIIVSFAVALILWIWSRKLVKAHSLSRFLPGPLIAVIIGLCVNELLKRVSPDLALTALEGHLVQIPRGGITSFLSHLPRPHWPAIAQLATWKVAGTIAAIASIETLLSVEAGDKIDPERRCTNTNRELIAQGTGNFLCGMFGGMPMTSAIVRTSANIYEGAKTKLACFMHGFFLLIAVFFLASALNHIPLAALAIVLISVGLKLVSIDFFKRTLAEGMEQFIPFIVTIVAVLLTDLLTGVGIGLVVGLAIVLRMNHHSALTMVQDGTDVLVRFAKDVTFVHKPELREILARIPEESTVVIDGTGAQFIDHDILEAVRDFEESALRRSIKVNLKNLRSRRMSFRGGYRGKL